jgi:FkbM family methyltransferase
MNSQHIFAQVVLRSWPFGRGVSRLMNALFSNLKFSETTATVKTTDGFKLKVCPNDLIGRHIYLTGEYERSILDVLYNFAKPGDVLLDIGANIGYVSMSFLHRVPGSQVIAVEPQEGVVSELLNENLSLFANRYRLFPVAISDRAGRASFKITDGNLGDGQIVEAGDHEVTLETGDALLRGVTKVDLIKIDIQGHELKALCSMQAALKRLRPRAILFEDDDGQLRDIMHLLGGLNYRVRAIQKTMRGFRIREVGSRRHDNYVAIRLD